MFKNVDRKLVQVDIEDSAEHLAEAIKNESVDRAYIQFTGQLSVDEFHTKIHAYMTKLYELLGDYYVYRPVIIGAPDIDNEDGLFDLNERMYETGLVVMREEFWDYSKNIYGGHPRDGKI